MLCDSCKFNNVKFVDIDTNEEIANCFPIIMFSKEIPDKEECMFYQNIEEEIENKIKEAIKHINESDKPNENDPVLSKICTETLDIINDYYKEPEDIEIGLYYTQNREYEYKKPSLHSILKEIKSDRYQELKHSWNFYWVELPSLVDYYHACLMLHYFEVMNNIPHNYPSEDDK